MAIFTLRLISDGGWAAVRENGQISPRSPEDELKMVFAAPMVSDRCVIRIENGQRARSSLTCPKGATSLSLGKVSDFENGRLQISIGADGSSSITVNYQFYAPWHMSASPDERNETGGDFTQGTHSMSRFSNPNPGETGSSFPGRRHRNEGRQGNDSQASSAGEQEALVKENARLKAELQKALNKTEELQSALQEMGAAAEDGKSLREAVEKQREEAAKAKEEQRRLAEENLRAAAEMKEIRKQTEETRRESETGRKELTELEEKLAQIRREIEEKKAEADETEKELTRIRQRTEELKTAHTDAEKSREELMKAREALGMKDREIEEAAAILSETSDRLKEIRQKKADTDQAREETETEYAKAEQALETAKTRLTAKQQETEEADRKLKETRKMLSKIQNEYHEAREEIAENITQFFSSHREFEQVSGDLDQAVEFLQKAAEDELFRAAMADFDRYKQTLDELRRQLMEVKTMYRETQRKLEDPQI